MDDIFFFFFLVARKLRECLVQFFANRFAFLLLLVQYVCKENQLRCTIKCRLLTRISINEHYLCNLCNYKDIYASKNEYFSFKSLPYSYSVGSRGSTKFINVT